MSKSDNKIDDNIIQSAKEVYDDNQLLYQKKNKSVMSSCAVQHAV